MITNQLVINENGNLFTTSEIIASGAEVEHRAVLQLINRHAPDLEEFGGVAFQMRPFETAGGLQTKRVAMLNEQQSTLLLTYLRNTAPVREFKKALVKMFYEMAKELQAPRQLSPDEIVAQALQITSKRVHELEAKIESDAPKVSYINRHVADNDLHLFRGVAANLNVGEQDLRNALLYQGWIYRETQKRRRKSGEIVIEHQWSAYADKKPYFHHSKNHEIPLFKGNTAHTLKMTTPGVAAVTRFVERQVAEHGSLRDALPVLEARYNARKN